MKQFKRFKEYFIFTLIACMMIVFLNIEHDPTNDGYKAYYVPVCGPSIIEGVEVCHLKEVVYEPRVKSKHGGW